ncbi:hypothetical protein BASA82_000771 [Batrachochytrium salamandrivorans]|nr:hypothetical protein BASA82_000771 [Batrachochytrium salamandrivorans]
MASGVQAPHSTLIMYLEYSPKVIGWIGSILDMNIDPNKDLMSILRNGDVFCRLACALYPRVECQLLEMGPRFAIHKIVFFLELCKSLHIKRALLFTVANLLVLPTQDKGRKSALIVLRTILALEKHARKSGWSGPALSLKSPAQEGHATPFPSESVDNSEDTSFSAVSDAQMHSPLSARSSNESGLSETNRSSNMSHELSASHPIAQSASGSLTAEDATYTTADSDAMGPNAYSLINHYAEGEGATRSASISHSTTSSSTNAYRLSASPITTQGHRVPSSSSSKGGSFATASNVATRELLNTTPQTLGDRGYSNHAIARLSDGSYSTSESESGAFASLPRSIGGDSVSDVPATAVHGSALLGADDFSAINEVQVMTPPPTRSLPSPEPRLAANSLAARGARKGSPQTLRSSADNAQASSELSDFLTTLDAALPSKKISSDNPLPTKYTKRNDAISILIEDETKFSANLSHLVQLLDHLIKKHHRRSNRLSKACEDMGSKAVKADKRSSSNFYSSMLKQQSGESDIAYLIRLETEIEEMTILHSMLRSILVLHCNMLSELRAAESFGSLLETPGSTLKVGDILLNFAENLRRPYTCYAVAALGSKHTRSDVVDFSDIDHDAFMKIVVQKFVSLSADEPSREDSWQWFIRRALVRLTSYPVFLDSIANPKQRFTKHVDLDNRKVKIAGIKLECIAKSIIEGLSL